MKFDWLKTFNQSNSSNINPLVTQLFNQNVHNTKPKLNNLIHFNFLGAACDVLKIRLGSV